MMAWLNAKAQSNIPYMSSTLETSQPPIGRLNAKASSNIYLISVTLSTRHAPMSLLSEEAIKNISYHRRDARDIPRADVVVEGGGIFEQRRCVRHPRCVPRRYVATSPRRVGQRQAATAVRMVVSSMT